MAFPDDGDVEEIEAEQTPPARSFMDTLAEEAQNHTRRADLPREDAEPGLQEGTRQARTSAGPAFAPLRSRRDNPGSAFIANTFGQIPVLGTVGGQIARTMLPAGYDAHSTSRGPRYTKAWEMTPVFREDCLQAFADSQKPENRELDAQIQKRLTQSHQQLVQARSPHTASAQQLKLLVGSGKKAQLQRDISGHDKGWKVGKWIAKGIAVGTVFLAPLVWKFCGDQDKREKDRERAVFSATTATRPYDIIMEAASPFAVEQQDVDTFNLYIDSRAWTEWDPVEHKTEPAAADDGMDVEVIGATGDDDAAMDGSTMQPPATAPSETCQIIRAKMEETYKQYLRMTNAALSGVTDPEEAAQIVERMKLARDHALDRLAGGDTLPAHEHAAVYYLHRRSSGHLDASGEPTSVDELDAEELDYYDSFVLDDDGSGIGGSLIENPDEGTDSQWLRQDRARLTDVFDRTIEATIEPKIQATRDRVQEKCGDPPGEDASAADKKAYADKKKALLEYDAVARAYAKAINMPNADTCDIEKCRDYVSQHSTDVKNLYENQFEGRLRINAREGSISFEFPEQDSMMKAFLQSKNPPTTEDYVEMTKHMIMKLMAECKNPPLKTINFKTTGIDKQYAGEVAALQEQVAREMLGPDAKITFNGGVEPVRGSGMAKQYADMQRDMSFAAVTQGGEQLKATVSKLQQANRDFEKAVRKGDVNGQDQAAAVMAETAQTLRQQMQQVGGVLGIQQNEKGEYFRQDGVSEQMRAQLQRTFDDASRAVGRTTENLVGHPAHVETRDTFVHIQESVQEQVDAAQAEQEVKATPRMH